MLLYALRASGEDLLFLRSAMRVPWSRSRSWSSPFWAGSEPGPADKRVTDSRDETRSLTRLTCHGAALRSESSAARRRSGRLRRRRRRRACHPRPAPMTDSRSRPLHRPPGCVSAPSHGVVLTLRRQQAQRDGIFAGLSSGLVSGASPSHLRASLHPPPCVYRLICTLFSHM